MRIRRGVIVGVMLAATIRERVPASQRAGRLKAAPTS